MTKIHKIIFSLILLIIISAAGYFIYSQNKVSSLVTPNPNPISETNVTFVYPLVLATKYIHAVTWPPQVVVTDGPLNCAKRIINSQAYCVTVSSEGAAGSIYTTYAYAFLKNDKVITLNFTLRAVQCDNYDDPQKTECKNERTTFNVDNLADSMAQSVQFADYKTFGEPVAGDLNSDGLLDKAVWLTESPGGSGTFYYAELLINTGTGYKATNTVFLGDRIAPQTLEILDGQAVCNFAEQKVGEPMTTPPSVGKSVRINYDATTNEISAQTTL